MATGFLTIGCKSHGERNPRQFALEVADEHIDTLSQALLDITVACARCHDHKFDPIAQKDYYALAEIMLSRETHYGTSKGVQNNHPTDLIDLGADSHMIAGFDGLAQSRDMPFILSLRINTPPDETHPPPATCALWLQSLYAPCTGQGIRPS